ncbi:unnamed protein product [Nyctereutes procyonoides]|uniref:(raccoon dog) hypothetical protein n=1 Tax=Nyctereutes procyonoides TaxID=34880 RepID=A0A811YMX8_NYCPR|nr:unnamed protein product [Nyctereutes procyonoides]
MLRLKGAWCPCRHGQEGLEDSPWFVEEQEKARQSSNKGKPIFFYEWDTKLNWKCTIKESGVKQKGWIEIPSLSEENEVDITRMNLSKKRNDDGTLGWLSEFTMGMVLPWKILATQELTAKRKLDGTGAVRILTVALLMMELFSTAVKQLHNICTVNDMVQKFSEKGGKFQMFDWYITSEYVKLLTNEKIIMKWRWQVELQLKCKGDSVSKEKSMKFCWQKQLFEEIKDLLQLTTLNG